MDDNQQTPNATPTPDTPPNVDTNIVNQEANNETGTFLSNDNSTPQPQKKWAILSNSQKTTLAALIVIVGVGALTTAGIKYQQYLRSKAAPVISVTPPVTPPGPTSTPTASPKSPTPSASPSIRPISTMRGSLKPISTSTTDPRLITIPSPPEEPNF